MENNIPKTGTFKRNLLNLHGDDDNTFLPPVLSSYAISLLGEANANKLPQQVQQQQQRQHDDTPKPTTITGIYELDFPENDHKNTLRNKLSVHFSESKEQQHQLQQRAQDRTNNSTNNNSNFSVYQDYENNFSSHSSMTTNNQTISEMNEEMNDSLHNHHSSNSTGIHNNNSPKSLPSRGSEVDTQKSGHLQVHSIRKFRGSKRFGKLLGPPKRSKPQTIENTIESSNNNFYGTNLTTPPPSYPVEFSQRLKTPTNEQQMNNGNTHETPPNFPIQQKSDTERPKVDSPQSKTSLNNEPRQDEFGFMSSQKSEELRERIEQQKLLNELERQRLKQLERMNKLDDIVMTGQENKDDQDVLRKENMLKEVNGERERELANKRVHEDIEFRKPKTLRVSPSLERPREVPVAIVSAPPQPQPRAASTSTKKKTITINGVQYEKLELLGRGGTSKVYKVKSLSSNKLYAIKKVTFDQFDDTCVKGFKGEIDLLLKLKNLERVVQIADYAIGEGSIYVVLECGDVDLAHVLQNKISMSQKLDLNFVKFHSIEILKCVLAVHQAGIVHSDLKPANFLFVRGILKIIDFGIANAVPDHTSNIYRESQIGTPNYMAPEAYIEVNQSFPGLPDDSSVSSGNGGKNGKNTWKVGMPSDVWSCGCIIYQMIYGKPPYGHYSGNQRIMAIMNPQVRIQYAATGIGGVKVPVSAIELMKKCLARNPNERFTIEECLNSDFLHPKIVNEGYIRDLVHLAVNFGINNRAGGSGIITAEIYDKLVDGVLKQIEELNYG